MDGEDGYVMASTDVLLSTREAAGVLNRPEATLRQWRHKDEGPPCFRQRGRVMYRRSALLGWLDAQEKATTRGDAA